MPPTNKLKIRAVRYRSACHRRRMNVAFKYTVLTLSFSFLTHYTVATYIRPTLYIVLLPINRTGPHNVEIL